MILSGKAERAFPRGGVVKKKKSENSDGTTVAKKYKENDDLFATKIEAAKKTFKSDSAKAKKKGNKKNKKDIDVDDILTVKQVTSSSVQRVFKYLLNNGDFNCSLVVKKSYYER